MAYKREDLNVERLERLMKGAGKKFVSLEEGATLMSLGRNNFREIAKDARAVYKIKRRVLINMEKIYEFMEAFVDDEEYRYGSQGTARGSRAQNREIESENPYEKVTKMVTKVETILIG